MSLLPLMYCPYIAINTLLKSLCYQHLEKPSSEMFIICIYAALHLCGVLALLWCYTAAAPPGCAPPVTLSFRGNPDKPSSTGTASVWETHKNVLQLPREPGDGCIGGGPGSRGKKGQGHRGSLPYASSAADVILPRNLPRRLNQFFKS